MKNPKLIELQEVRREFYHSLKLYWEQENVYTPSWWILVALVFVPWLIWWRFVRRDKLLTILMFGIIVGLLNLLGDSLRSNLLISEYPVRLFWFLYPNLFPYDIAFLPVCFMYIFQKTLHQPARKYFLYLFVLALLLSFVIEPCLQFLNIMKYMIHWDYTFAIMNHFAIGTVAYGITRLMLNRQIE